MTHDDKLTQKVADKDPISWSQFKATGSGDDSYPLVLLHQEDFADGTIIVARPAYLKLAEDIVFEPNAEDGLIPLPE